MAATKPAEPSKPPRWLAYMKVRDLVPNPKNPKKHDVPGIAASLKRFGFIDASVLDERTGMLIGGHGRAETLLWAQQMTMDVPEGIVVDGDGDWTQPVQRGWSSKDDAEAMGAIVTLNRQVEMGGWDAAELADALSMLSSIPGGLEGVGFDANQTADILAGLAGPPNLDDLDSDTSPHEFWPVLRFKVSPELRTRYLALVDGIDGGDEALFAYLVDKAAATVRAERMEEVG